MKEPNKLKQRQLEKVLDCLPAKKVFIPKNGCKPDCEKCRIEIDNWNQAIDDTRKNILNLKTL